MSFSYLWINRDRPKLLSAAWVKAWAKRIVNGPRLLKIILKRIGFQFDGAVIGRLTVLEAVVVNGPHFRLHVGERSFLGAGVHLALHEKIEIGNRVVINNGAQLLTASHDTRDSGWAMNKKKIVIEDYAWIATNAIILPGVRIGTGAVVGAGAVVSRDVPDFCIATGNPARVVGQRVKELQYSPVDLCAPFEAWISQKKAD